jgi:hypothetical protein
LTENLTVKLFTELYQRSKISMKGREKLQNAPEYFKVKSASEDRLIENEGFLDFFRDCLPSDIESMIIDCCPPDFINETTLYFIVVDTLKRFIDSDLEYDPNCIKLYRVYKKMRAKYPFMPQETDGFADWLGGRELRRKIESWRETGEGCIYCFNEDSVYSNGNMFSCRLCKRSWRKPQS